MPIGGGPNLAEFLRRNHRRSVPFCAKSPVPKEAHTANPESCLSPSRSSSQSSGDGPDRVSFPASVSDSSDSSSSTDSSLEHLAPCKCAVCDGPEDGAKRCAQSGMVQRGETSDGKSEWWLMDPSLQTECSAHDRNNGPALERWMGAVRKVTLPLPHGVRASVAKQDGKVPDGVVYVWFGNGVTLFGDATCPPPEAAILSQTEFADPIPIVAVDPGNPDYRQVSSRQGTTTVTMAPRAASIDDADFLCREKGASRPGHADVDPLSGKSSSVYPGRRRRLGGVSCWRGDPRAELPRVCLSRSSPGSPVQRRPRLRTSHGAILCTGTRLHVHYARHVQHGVHHCVAFVSASRSDFRASDQEAS